MAGRTHDIKSGAGASCHLHSKFNRKFNTQRKRMERWHNIVMKLTEFEGLINNYDGASPDEVRDLRAIHAKLSECYSTAKRYEGN